MIALYINDQRAVIKSGTSIKLTRENPFFTNSGDYTLDVVLPLTGCLDNLRIFGALHYRAMSLKFLTGKKYPFRLVSELLTLEGSAIVTNVTQDEIKVQLLAGNSALNINSFGEDGELYIDELDLGRVYGELYDEQHSGSSKRTKQDVQNTLNWLYGMTKSERMKLIHGSREETDAVCFPIYSQTDGGWSNEHVFADWCSSTDNLWNKDADSYGLNFGQLRYADKDDNHRPGDGESVPFSPMPYLSFIAERILKAIGFTLKKEDNALAGEEFCRVFIANARTTIYYCDCLPHWTIKDFFNEIRNLFGACVYIDGNRAVIKTRQDIYGTGASVQELYNTIDERSTDIDNNSDTKDTTAGNVAYAFGDVIPMVLNIGQSAYENMDVIEVASYNEMQQYFNDMSDEDKSKSNTLFILRYAYSQECQKYAIFNTAQEGNDAVYELKQVDQAGPLLRDEDYDVDIEMKIVPCATANTIPTKRYHYIAGQDTERWGIYELNAIYPDELDWKKEGGSLGGFHIPYLVTADTRDAINKDLFSLQGAINEEEEEEENKSTSKQDILEVGVVAHKNYQAHYNLHYGNGLFGFDVEMPYAIGVPFLVGEDKITVDSTTLIESNELNINNSYSETGRIIRIGNIDTRVVHQISFTDTACDPNKVYLINGRKYACQKIELTIDDNGVQRLKKGYFYEVY